MNPRPYQQSSLDAIVKGFDEFNKQLLVLPTGGGKTIVFSWLARLFQPRRTCILAHREELLDQAIAKLFSAAGIIAQKEKAEFRASIAAPVVVASVQTMIRRLDKWPADHFGLVVADEAHHAVSDSWQTVLNHFSGAKVLGVSATPDRADERQLGEYFENIAYEVGLFDLINDGFLCPIAVKSIPIRINLSGVKQTAGDYDSAELGHAIEPYLDSIAGAMLTHAAGRKTLVFLPLIATSRRFTDICREHGLRAEHIDGTSEDRKEKLERFAEGEFDVLCNAMLLTEGYDEPSIDCILNLRPTRSRPLFSQIIGRGTRTCEGKENLLLLDPLFLHERLKIVVPANLIAKTDEEAEAITRLLQDKSTTGGQGEDLQQAAAEARAAREETLRKKLESLATRKAALLTPEQFALRYHRLDVAEYQPVMKWESEPVTPKQAPYLEKAGINVDEVRGKGHAVKLLDIHFAELNKEPASHKQRWVMSRANWKSKDGKRNAWSATRGDARDFFAARNKPETAA